MFAYHWLLYSGHDALVFVCWYSCIYMHTEPCDLPATDSQLHKGCRERHVRQKWAIMSVCHQTTSIKQTSESKVCATATPYLTLPHFFLNKSLPEEHLLRTWGNTSLTVKAVSTNWLTDRVSLPLTITLSSGPIQKLLGPWEVADSDEFTEEEWVFGLLVIHENVHGASSQLVANKCPWSSPKKGSLAVINWI